MRGSALAVLLALSLTAASGAETNRECVIKASADWIPTVACTDVRPGSALDFSGFGFADGPCGKYGRVVARGDHFEFERRPGEARRFLGVNLCEDANTMPPEASRRMIDNLVKLGYNTVRLHHHERSMTDPKGNGIAFDPAALDRFDALVAACRERGVYVTTDLIVSRRIPWRSIGEDRDGEVPNFSVLQHFHRGAHSNYLAFARNLLSHVNPRTGLRLADDPTLAWLSLVNEGNLSNWGMRPYAENADLVLPRWRKWLAAKRKADAAYAAVPDTLPERLDNPGESAHAAAFLQFLAAVETRFVAHMRRFLRDELGCKALVTDMNAWTFPAAFLPVRNSLDYVDNHFYLTHPEFLGPHWTLPTRITDGNWIRKNDEFGVPYNVGGRLLGRPFTVSEYNYCAPGRFRAAAGFLCGSAAALQGWSSIWRFCWTCSARGAVDASAKSMNYFDIAGDPVMLATERAICCLYMRRDLPELRNEYPFLCPPSRLASPRPEGWRTTRWLPNWTALRAKIGSLVEEQAPQGVPTAGTFPVFKTREEIGADLGHLPAAQASTADGAVVSDRERGSFKVDTPRTAGGFLESDGRIETAALTAEVHGAPAALWASSLSAQPIGDAERLLVTFVTDVQQDGIRYQDDTLRVLLGWGKFPKLMRRANAEVSVAVAAGRTWRVYALSPDGSRKRELPGRIVNGRLTFTADIAGDPTAAEYLYELTAK